MVNCTLVRALSSALLSLAVFAAFVPGVSAASKGEIAARQWCSGCHGIRANEPSANPKAPNFAAVANERSITRYSLNVFLRTSHPTMPNFVLSQPEIDEFVDFILSMKTTK